MAMKSPHSWPSGGHLWRPEKGPTRVRHADRPATDRHHGSNAHNYDAVADLVAERVVKSQGRISAKWLLPTARYQGPDRNRRPVVTGTRGRSHVCETSRRAP